MGFYSLFHVFFLSIGLWILHVTCMRWTRGVGGPPGNKIQLIYRVKSPKTCAWVFKFFFTLSRVWRDNYKDGSSFIRQVLNFSSVPQVQSPSGLNIYRIFYCFLYIASSVINYRIHVSWQSCFVCTLINHHHLFVLPSGWRIST